jgi:hypothetical protein
VTKLFLSAGVLVALAIPATSSAGAKWLNPPACTANTTSITCTGKATGISRPTNNPLGVGLGPLQAGLTARVRYTCVDGNPDPFTAFEPQVAVVEIKNAQPFALTFSPEPAPAGLIALASCVTGVWARNASYYEVSVDAGWGFGAPSGANVALTGPVGTVSAS